MSGLDLFMGPPRPNPNILRRQMEARTVIEMAAQGQSRLTAQAELDDAKQKQNAERVSQIMAALPNLDITDEGTHQLLQKEMASLDPSRWETHYLAGQLTDVARARQALLDDSAKIETASKTRANELAHEGPTYQFVASTLRGMLPLVADKPSPEAALAMGVQDMVESLAAARYDSDDPATRFPEHLVKRGYVPDRETYKAQLSERGMYNVGQILQSTKLPDYPTARSAGSMAGLLVPGKALSGPFVGLARLGEKAVRSLFKMEQVVEGSVQATKALKRAQELGSALGFGSVIASKGLPQDTAHAIDMMGLPPEEAEKMKRDAFIYHVTLGTVIGPAVIWGSRVAEQASKFAPWTKFAFEAAFLPATTEATGEVVNLARGTLNMLSEAALGKDAGLTQSMERMAKVNPALSGATYRFLKGFYDGVTTGEWEGAVDAAVEYGKHAAAATPMFGAMQLMASTKMWNRLPLPIREAFALKAIEEVKKIEDPTVREPLTAAVEALAEPTPEVPQNLKEAAAAKLTAIPDVQAADVGAQAGMAEAKMASEVAARKLALAEREGVPEPERKKLMDQAAAWDSYARELVEAAMLAERGEPFQLPKPPSGEVPREMSEAFQRRVGFGRDEALKRAIDEALGREKDPNFQMETRAFEVERDPRKLQPGDVIASRYGEIAVESVHPKTGDITGYRISEAGEPMTVAQRDLGRVIYAGRSEPSKMSASMRKLTESLAGREAREGLPLPERQKAARTEQEAAYQAAREAATRRLSERQTAAERARRARGEDLDDPPNLLSDGGTDPSRLSLAEQKTAQQVRDVGAKAMQAIKETPHAEATVPTAKQRDVALARVVDRALELLRTRKALRRIPDTESARAEAVLQAIAELHPEMVSPRLATQRILPFVRKLEYWMEKIYAKKDRVDARLELLNFMTREKAAIVGSDAQILKLHPDGRKFLDRLEAIQADLFGPGMTAPGEVYGGIPVKQLFRAVYPWRSSAGSYHMAADLDTMVKTIDETISAMQRNPELIVGSTGSLGERLLNKFTAAIPGLQNLRSLGFIGNKLNLVYAQTAQNLFTIRTAIVGKDGLFAREGIERGSQRSKDLFEALNEGPKSKQWESLSDRDKEVATQLRNMFAKLRDELIEYHPKNLEFEREIKILQQQQQVLEERLQSAAVPVVKFAFEKKRDKAVKVQEGIEQRTLKQIAKLEQRKKELEPKPKSDRRSWATLQKVKTELRARNKTLASTRAEIAKLKSQQPPPQPPLNPALQGRVKGLYDIITNRITRHQKWKDEFGFDNYVHWVAEAIDKVRPIDFVTTDGRFSGPPAVMAKSALQRKTKGDKGIERDVVVSVEDYLRDVSIAIAKNKALSEISTFLYGKERPAQFADFVSPSSSRIFYTVHQGNLVRTKNAGIYWVNRKTGDLVEATPDSKPPGETAKWKRRVILVQDNRIIDGYFQRGSTKKFMAAPEEVKRNLKNGTLIALSLAEAKSKVRYREKGWMDHAATLKAQLKQGPMTVLVNQQTGDYYKVPSPVSVPGFINRLVREGALPQAGADAFMDAMAKRNGKPDWRILKKYNLALREAKQSRGDQMERLIDQFSKGIRRADIPIFGVNDALQSAEGFVKRTLRGYGNIANYMTILAGDPAIAVNAAVGGMFLSSTVVPARLLTKTMPRVFEYWARDRVAKRGKNVSFESLGAPDKMFEGGISKIRIGDEKVLRTSKEDLQKMSPEQRADQQIFDDGYVALSGRAIFSGRMANMGRSLASREPEKGRAAKALEKAYDIGAAPMARGEAVVRSQLWLSVYYAARKSGRDNTISERMADQAVDMTQGVFTLLGKSDFSRSWAGPFVGGVQHWAMHFAGMTMRAPMQYKLRLAALGMTVTAFMQELFGSDWTRTIGSSLHDIPGLGEMFEAGSAGMSDILADEPGDNPLTRMMKAVLRPWFSTMYVPIPIPGQSPAVSATRRSIESGMRAIRGDFGGAATGLVDESVGRLVPNTWRRLSKSFGSEKIGEHVYMHRPMKILGDARASTMIQKGDGIMGGLGYLLKDIMPGTPDFEAQQARDFRYARFMGDRVRTTRDAARRKVDRMMDRYIQAVEDRVPSEIQSAAAQLEEAAGYARQHGIKITRSDLLKRREVRNMSMVGRTIVNGVTKAQQIELFTRALPRLPDSEIQRVAHVLGGKQGFGRWIQDEDVPRELRIRLVQALRERNSRSP